MLCTLWHASVIQEPRKFLFLKSFFVNHWFYKRTEDTQPLLLSASTGRVKINGNVALHLRVGDSLTTALFAFVKKLAIDVLLGVAFINDHIRAIRPDEQKVDVRESAAAAIMKHHDVSATAFFRK